MYLSCKNGRKYTADLLPRFRVRYLRSQPGQNPPHPIPGSEWIFPSLRDAEKPINPNTAYGTFKRIIKKAGLPDIPFHGLRHTYATHSIAVGVDEKTLAKELGHTKPGFTLDCYAHVTEEMQKRASEVTGNALEKILGKELKPWADERTDKG